MLPAMPAARSSAVRLPPSLTLGGSAKRPLPSSGNPAGTLRLGRRLDVAKAALLITSSLTPPKLLPPSICWAVAKTSPWRSELPGSAAADDSSVASEPASGEDATPPSSCRGVLGDPGTLKHPPLSLAVSLLGDARQSVGCATGVEGEACSAGVQVAAACC